MENFEEKEEEVKLVAAKTPKEMKAMYRPEFQRNPAKYYPTKVFDKFGYTRHQCPKCNNFYWRYSDKQDTCGDSACVGKYTFIGKPTGVGQEKKMTYKDAWDNFEKSFTSARKPCTPVKRYPVTARWRNDVDFVAAGIYCFQPYCMTGELQPPANPLIQPQFCVRFNDLDNIGLTGRHYSGFIMIGIQSFCYPGTEDKTFFSEECVEFNLNWLIDGLKVPKDEITLIEDIWSGGGNLGSCVEYFVKGLEVGNMVFTMYKYYPDGKLEDLEIKVIDVGIGMERIPWLINGTPTSYLDVFSRAYSYLQSKLNIDTSTEIWEKIGPYTCHLNADESDDMEKTWEKVASSIGLTVAECKKAITPVKELYIVLDHTRSALVTIQDGALPSNVGGGSNIRNIIRRVFAIMKKNGWLEKMGGMEGFLKLFEYHMEDLEQLYGKFPEYKSFNKIIEIEYNKWASTDATQKKKVLDIFNKKKTLTLNDWIVAIESYGMSPDTISEITGLSQPDNLYYEMDLKKLKLTKPPEQILYQTANIQETANLFYEHQKEFNFDAKIVEIFADYKNTENRNIVILDKSAFYPTSGGQQNDIGKLTIDGQVYNVVNVEKVGKCVLHILDRSLPNPDNSHYIGQTIAGEVDKQRRNILRNHHTATHIVFAACRRVLGPHVWQNGAKKTITMAHLDITHYSSLTEEEEMEIEREANNIVFNSINIHKEFVNKADAEKEHGFRLYQGGVVPGDTLRVVNIEGTDVEACCGTHCDNTSEVGLIRILKTKRISDGILRLYFVAGEKSLEKLTTQTQVLKNLQTIFNVQQNDLVTTAERFFTERNKFQDKYKSSTQKILNFQMELLLSSDKFKKVFVRSSESETTLYFSLMGNYVKGQKDTGKGIVFVGDDFVFGQFGNKADFDHEKFLALLQEDNPDAKYKKCQTEITVKENKKPVKLENVLQFSFNGVVKFDKVKQYLTNNGVTEAVELA